MVVLSRNLSRKAAMEMLLLGDMVGADHAKALGLVNRVVDTDRVLNEAEALGRVIASKPSVTLGEIVETGPDRAVDGVVRWRRIDLKRVIEERFDVVYSERGISRLALSRYRRSAAENVAGNRLHVVADAVAQVRNESARSSLKCGRRSR